MRIMIVAAIMVMQNVLVINANNPSSPFHSLSTPLGRSLSDLAITNNQYSPIKKTDRVTHANALTFLFFESFFIVIRLPCLSAYALGSLVAYILASPNMEM